MEDLNLKKSWEWTVRVDIDGVVALSPGVLHKSWYNGPPDYSIFKPDPKAVKFLKFLRKQGFKILLHTARFKQDRKVTLQWLEKYKIPFDTLLMAKPRSVAEIDDMHLDYSGDFGKYRKQMLCLKEKIDGTDV